MKLSVQFLMIAILGLTAMPAGASKVEHLTVSKTVILDAPANTVWKALRIIRNSDSRQHRVVSHSGMGAQVQENFEVPVIGPVSCLYQEREIECRRVEYHLISSPNFIAFEGAWDVVPCAGGKTTVTLTSFADTGSHLPFAAKITRTQTARRVDIRMGELKDAVEHPPIAALPR